MTSVTSLHTFRVDVTPPVGTYLCGGLHDRSVGVETPLWLRGIVLSTAETRYVVACIDFCYLVGRSQARLIEALAEGARVPAGQVVVQSNHLHDAPLIDEEAHALVAEYSPEHWFHDESYFADLLARAKEAVRAVLEDPGIEMGGVGVASHPVRQFASTRRVIDEHNRCHVRYSVCRDPWIREQPEGRIDPDLDAVVLYNRDSQPVVCLGFYASHPQVSDGRRVASGDTIGVALDLFEHAQPDVFPIYFTGCGGDVTAGKYTTTHRKRNRLVFGVRLYDGLQGAFEKASLQAGMEMEWRDAVHEVPLRKVTESEDELIETVRGAEWRTEKYLAAGRLHRLRNGIDTYPFRIARLRLGHATILFLPAEMCIGYQLYVKGLMKGPMAVAAYGDGFLKYVETDEAFDQGGYEVDPKWTEVEKGIEKTLKAYLDEALAD